MVRKKKLTFKTELTRLFKKPKTRKVKVRKLTKTKKLTPEQIRRVLMERRERTKMRIETARKR